MKRFLIFIALVFCIALPLQAQVFTIIDILLNSVSNEDEFTIFLFVLSEADDELLDDFGRTDNEWTVFAPTDEAFLQFLDASDSSIRDLMADERLLKEILDYHIVEGSYTYADLADIDSISPLLTGTEISISAGEGGLQLDNHAEIIIENVAARNGVLHVINEVLTAPTVRESLDMPEMTPEPEATEEAGG